MDFKAPSTFSESISVGYGVDPAIVAAVAAGDGDVNYKDLLLNMFAAFDELEALGLVDKDRSIFAKVEIANALAWAGPKIREFDDKAK